MYYISSFFHSFDDNARTSVQLFGTRARDDNSYDVALFESVLTPIPGSKVDALKEVIRVVQFNVLEKIYCTCTLSDLGRRRGLVSVYDVAAIRIGLTRPGGDP